MVVWSGPPFPPWWAVVSGGGAGPSPRWVSLWWSLCQVDSSLFFLSFPPSTPGKGNRPAQVQTDFAYLTIRASGSYKWVLQQASAPQAADNTNVKWDW